jgi:hypothetical protein
MDAIDQVLATGGASGITITVLFLLYKFFWNRHLRSKCCGREIDIDTQVSTPKIVVENRDAQVSTSHTSQDESLPEGRSGRAVCENQGGVSGRKEGENASCEARKCSPESGFTAENPLFVVVS